LLLALAGLLVNCGDGAGQPSERETPTPPTPSASPECLTASELRAQVQTNWTLGNRPGAEVIDTGDSVEVIVHDIDGSDYTITYAQFRASSRQAARECRANASS
jgi:hypothetical protein